MTTLATLATLGATADPYDGHMWGGHGWMWLWGTLMMLVVIAAALAGVWLVVRGSRHPEPRPGERARDILAERYARGELTADEYRERLDTLR
jgi:putative membrane protein